MKWFLILIYGPLLSGLVVFSLSVQADTSAETEFYVSQFSGNININVPGDNSVAQQYCNEYWSRNNRPSGQPAGWYRNINRCTQTPREVRIVYLPANSNVHTDSKSVFFRAEGFHSSNGIPPYQPPPPPPENCQELADQNPDPIFITFPGVVAPLYACNKGCSMQAQGLAIIHPDDNSAGGSYVFTGNSMACGGFNPDAGIEPVEEGGKVCYDSQGNRLPGTVSQNVPCPELSVCFSGTSMQTVVPLGQPCPDGQTPNPVDDDGNPTLPDGQTDSNESSEDSVDLPGLDDWINDPDVDLPPLTNDNLGRVPSWARPLAPDGTTGAIISTDTGTSISQTPDGSTATTTTETTCVTWVGGADPVVKNREILGKDCQTTETVEVDQCKGESCGGAAFNPDRWTDCSKKPPCTGDAMQCASIYYQWEQSCKSDGFTASGDYISCNQTFECESSSPFQCYLAKQTHIDRCIAEQRIALDADDLLTIATIYKDAPGMSDAVIDPQTGSIADSLTETFNVSQILDMSFIANPSGRSGSCPPTSSLTLMGQSITFSYEYICDMMIAVRPLVLLSASFFAFVMFASGVLGVRFK